MSDGSFTAKIPVCTPEESAKVRFIATIHGKKFYSDWYSFMPTTPEVYSTINISPRYYEFGTGYYYDTLVCNGTWPSHSSHPTDGEVQSIIIDGIEIQGVVKVRKVSQDRDYYELNEIRLIAPQNKSFRSIVISKPWYSDPEAITLNVDSGQTGTLKLIPGGGGLGTHGESFPLLRSYWVGDCNRLVFKQSLNATLAIELK